MRFLILYILTIFSLFLPSNSFSQCLIGAEDLKVKFLKEKVEVKSGKTFFDVLNIENISAHPISFQISYNVPKDWKIIGLITEKYNIDANTKLNIPVRVVVANNANGGVGYVVAASIHDENGSLFRTEYSYLVIPAETGLIITAGNKTSYFDNNTLEGEFSIKIRNQGNIDEIIHIEAIPDKSVTIYDSENNLYLKDINLGPTTDTTIFIKTKLINLEEYKRYLLHKISLTVSGKDTMVNKTIWFKYLNWMFENYIPDASKPMIIELTALNIFNQTPASYRGRIYGNVLLKNRRSIFYSAENWNRSSNKNNLWLNSKIGIGYSSPKTYLYFGDYSGNFQLSMFGRGFYGVYHLTKRQSLSAAITERVLRPVNNYGGSYKIMFKKGFGFELGGAYSINKQYNSDAKTIFERTFFNLLNKNRFDILFGYGETNYLLNNINVPYRGYGYNFDYSGSLKKIKINLKSYFGTADYPGYTKGRLYISGIANTHIDSNKDIIIQYSKQRYQPSYFIDNIYYADRFSNYEQLKTSLGINLENNIYLFTGPIIENQGTNNYAVLDPSTAFQTLTTKGELGIRIFEKYTNNTITFTGRYGLVNVYQFSNVLNGIYRPELRKPKPYPSAEVILNIKRKNFGAYFVYFYGPYNLSQQFSYFYYSYFTRTLNIMPFYETYIYKKSVKLGIKGTYINNLSSSNSRLNINTRIDIYAKKGWSFYLLNALNFQTRRGSGLQGNNFYSSTYFEFGLRKVFEWNQPRLKYHDFNAIFYKDLNGNRIHDENEPGVSNVLVNIQREDPLADALDPNYNGEFMNAELLSNAEGKIKYKNIVNGDYKLVYAQTSSYKDNFSAEESQRKFLSSKDTLIYIPFTEKNKVFGRVVIHRVPHSGLDDVPLDNIKITVEGSGKFYDGLTDKTGYFELFLPVSDYYKVSINNIYYENFNLRRDYYIVKFNGYKQFEVTFDFDEKKREIRFEDQDFIVNEADDFNIEDIKVIRQTNLKGIVRDENSLNPIHSKIQVRNSKTNELIVESASSNRTGEYFATFFAGENYVLTAETKGYWNYKEKLEIDQITAFDNITRDILLLKIFDGEKMPIDNLNFEYGKNEISQIAKVQLNLIINKLENNPDVKIEIRGYTDNLEAINLNAKQLSDARAKSVANYIKSKGIRGDRIIEKGMNDRNPAYSNDSETGRYKNRRVEIIVVYKNIQNH